MPSLTIKDWAAEYRTANEQEHLAQLANLPHESPADSVRDYFALARLAIQLSGEPAETGALWEARLQHYRAVLDNWQRLAQHFKHGD